jgi:acetoin utilization deacetylase AcuC-like enzyme
MLKTAVIADDRYADHRPGRSHPERPERIKVINDTVRALRRDSLRIMAPREATLEQIASCHDQRYIAEIARTAGLERYDFDPDTRTSPGSFRTALLSAGGVIVAIEAVLDGAANNAFAVVRPPGHHARPARAMGFCLFNNVAIGASWLVNLGFRRVLIIDWDVHHGNGTQEIFYGSADVMYISLHQYPHYPGTGLIGEMGVKAGSGYTLNVPMPPNLGDGEYLRVFDELVLPAARNFAPEFVLVSAGFDCHFRDPLASMCVTELGFAAMTRRVKRLAAECADGRLVLALEGGYDLQALAESSSAVINELGYDPDEKLQTISGNPGDGVMPLIERIRATREALTARS